MKTLALAAVIENAPCVTRLWLQAPARCVFEKRVRQLVSRHVGEGLGMESRLHS